VSNGGRDLGLPEAYLYRILAFARPQASNLTVLFVCAALSDLTCAADIHEDDLCRHD
jgi:hypothetical protein